jgi:NTE family protein
MPQVNLAARYGYARVSLPYGRYNAFNYHLCGVDLYLSRLASPDFDLQTGLRYDNYWVRTTERYAPRQAYTTLYISWRDDLFDTAYTPTRGYAYSVEAAYNIKDRTLQGSNFWALQAEISAALPLGRTTTLLPSLHVRSLLGKSIPQVYANTLGGYLPTRYLPQQMSFVGFMGCEQVYPHLILPRIGLRQRLIPDVYATAWANYAYSREAFTSDSLEQCIWGVGLQLSYDTTLGPVSLCAHWSDLYHRLGAYFSFGLEF